MASSPWSVRACLCHRQSFEDLHALAVRRAWKTVAQISAATRCGTGCGLCRPYLARMLATGETAFDVMGAEEAARWLERTDGPCGDAPMRPLCEIDRRADGR